MVRVMQLAAASSYAVTSVLILLFNKIILSTYHFKFPFTMALSHMCVGLFLLYVLKAARVISYAPFDWALAKKAFPVSLCFIANCVLGMVALKGTNIPMFATLRRLTIFMVVLCEVVVLRKKQTLLVVLSVFVMVFGSFIGGWGDLQFDFFGYAMVLLNNLVTALNLVFIKKTLMDTKLASDTFGVLYYNSLLSIPFLCLFVVLSGEFLALPSFEFTFDLGFQTYFLLSACMSFLMNYSTYWCTEVNSALTTSVTGQVKNVLSSFVSLSMVQGSGVGVQATPLLITGLSVGLLGSFMYAYAVYKQDQQRQRRDAEKKQEIALQQASATTIVSRPNDDERDDARLLSSSGSVDENLSLLTHGLVNGLHTTSKAAERHHHNAAAAANNASGGMGDSSGGHDEADAKMMRLEAGQRSPMVGGGHAHSNVPLVYPSFPSGMVTPGGRNAVPQSPNPQHPYNNPHKSKPN